MPRAVSQTNRRTPWRRMASIRFRVPSERMRVGRNHCLCPRADNTASWPRAARSSEEGSRTLPRRVINPGRASPDGSLRTKAVTRCPRSIAWLTSCRPVPPVAPTIRRFTERLAVQHSRPPASRLGIRHLVHVVVLARVLGDLQPDLLPPAGLGDGLVLDLHGFDALAKIARVSEDADRVTHAQGSRFEPYRRDGKMAVIVGHETHPLFARQGAARGSRRDCRRAGLGRRPSSWLFLRRRAARRRLPRRGLLERFGLLADRRFSGRRLLAFDFGFRFSLCGGHGVLPQVCG